MHSDEYNLTDRCPEKKWKFLNGQPNLETFDQVWSEQDNKITVWRYWVIQIMLLLGWFSGIRLFAEHFSTMVLDFRHFNPQWPKLDLFISLLMAQWVDMEAGKIRHWAHVGAWSPYLRLIWDYWLYRSAPRVKKHETEAWFLFSNASMSTHWAIRRVTVVRQNRVLLKFCEIETFSHILMIL